MKVGGREIKIARLWRKQGGFGRGWNQMVSRVQGVGYSILELRFFLTRNKFRGAT